MMSRFKAGQFGALSDSKIGTAMGNGVGSIGRITMHSVTQIGGNSAENFAKQAPRAPKYQDRTSVVNGVIDVARRGFASMWR